MAELEEKLWKKMMKASFHTSQNVLVKHHPCKPLDGSR
jgi:hypothetical protein